MKTGVIRNPDSHGNRRAGPMAAPPDVAFAQPESPGDVAAAVAGFAKAGVELLVIDGGDGTVREVLGALPAAYGARPPLLSVVASGKTNILAFDLGVRRSWTLDRALAGEGRVKTRSPLEVTRGGETLRGFVFGAAGLVRATALAGDLHRARVFHNASVGLTLAGAVGQFLGGDSAWRQGEALSLAVDGGPARSGARLVSMATTLQRLPFGMRPFGPARHGLKYLDVDAPPKGLLRALPTLLWGRHEGWLGANGYRRGDAKRLTLVLEGSFVLDGEVYPGGELMVAEGAPLRFLTP
ncbi:MAG: diacylglycerol kinase family protein [Phenylobacterium sp.]